MRKFFRDLSPLQKTFWITFVLMLGITVPHFAYVLSTLMEDSPLTTTLSYGIAILLELIVFWLTITTYSIDGKHKMLKAIPFYLVILALCLISFYFQAIYVHHFYRPELLSGAQDVPFYQYLPYVGSSFPVFTILFAVMSEFVGRTMKVVEKDERTLEQIKRDNQAEIDRAKEEKRKRDELAKMRPNTIAEAARVLKEGYDGARKQLSRESSNKGNTGSSGTPPPPPTKQKPPQPAPPVPAPMPVPAPKIERIEDTDTQPQIAAVVSGKQMTVINKIKTDQSIRIGNVPYWTYERYVRELNTLHPELKVSRRKLEALVEQKKLTTSFYYVVTQGQQRVMTLKASPAGQGKIVEELRKSHLTIISRASGGASSSDFEEKEEQVQ